MTGDLRFVDIRGVARRLPLARLPELPECRHSPHRDPPATLIAAAAAFIRPHTRRDHR